MANDSLLNAGFAVDHPSVNVTLNGIAFHWDSTGLYRVVNGRNVRTTDPNDQTVFGAYWASIQPTVTQLPGGGVLYSVPQVQSTSTSPTLILAAAGILLVLILSRS